MEPSVAICRKGVGTVFPPFLFLFFFFSWVTIFLLFGGVQVIDMAVLPECAGY